MRLVLILLCLVSFGVGSYVLIRYAKGELPKYRLWRLKLFGSGFASGALGAWAIFYSLPWNELLIAMILQGLVLALLTTYALPYNIQEWYPKRDR
jgi:hypothetical protein